MILMIFVCYLITVVISFLCIDYYNQNGWRASYNCNGWTSVYTFLMLIPIVNLIAGFMYLADAKGWG